MPLYFILQYGTTSFSPIVLKVDHKMFFINDVGKNAILNGYLKFPFHLSILKTYFCGLYKSVLC